MKRTLIFAGHMSLLYCYSIQEKDSESRRRLLTVGMVIEGRAEQTAHAGLIRI